VLFRVGRRIEHRDEDVTGQSNANFVSSPQFSAPSSNLNSARRAARGRFSTIVENRRAPYQEGVRSSRRLPAGVDLKTSSSYAVDALASCSLTVLRLPELLDPPQALATPRRRRRSSCSFSTQTATSWSTTAVRSHGCRSFLPCAQPSGITLMPVWTNGTHRTSVENESSVRQASALHLGAITSALKRSMRATHS